MDISINTPARWTFGTSLVIFCASLSLSLLELISSTKSLEIELSDMQDLDESIVENIKNMRF
jgi:hypothetical protein